MRYFRKYNEETREYEREVRVFDGCEIGCVAGYLYVEFTPPPMPEPEITDGVYWCEDCDGDSGIICRYKGNWTSSEFISVSTPRVIIEKLSK